MADYPEYARGTGSYNTICTFCKKKRKKDGNSFCQSCIDFKDFGNRFQEIEQTERERAAKKVLIEDREKMLVELQKKIQEDKEELQTIEDILLLQQQSIKMHSDVISDDIRRYRTLSGKSSLLETHCTIVRPMNSQENVYFGHVTLIITYPSSPLEYILHYGIKMFNNLPEKLNHEFWIPSDKPNIPADSLIGDFGNFNFPPTTTLSDIMKKHFIDCCKVFDRSQWSDQIWKKTDTIKDEPVTVLLSRLKQQEFDRSTLDSSYIERRLKRIPKTPEFSFQPFKATPVTEEDKLLIPLVTEDESKRRQRDDKIREQEAIPATEEDNLRSLVTEDESKRRQRRQRDAKIREKEDADRLSRANQAARDREKEDADRLSRANQAARDREKAAEADVVRQNAAAKKAEDDRLGRENQAARDRENAKAKPNIFDVVKKQKDPEVLEYLNELILAKVIGADVDAPIAEIKDVSAGNNKRRKEDLKIKSFENTITELKKEVDKFVEEEKSINLTAGEAMKSSIYILNNFEKKANEIRDLITEETNISGKNKAKIFVDLSSIINTINAKKKIYSQIKGLIDQIFVLNTSEKSLTSMSGDKKNNEIFELLRGYRLWMYKCDKVISENDVQSINTDLQKLIISKHETLKDLLRDFYRNNKIKNEDNRVIIENLRMIDPTYTFTQDKLSQLVDGLRHENGGNLTTNDILALIDTYKQEADQTPDIEPDNLINMQLAISAYNKIIKELEKKVFIGFRKTIMLSDIDRKSEEFKNVTSELIEEQTEYLEEINENIERLNTFPNLPVTVKKEARDTLVRWKDSLENRIQYIGKLVAAQEGEDVPNEIQDALNSFYTILKDLRKEVYKNMNDYLDHIDFFTDEEDEIITSLIVKLENSLEKVNTSIKSLKENKIIPKSDATCMHAFFFTLAIRLKSILSLFIDIDIPEMKKQISEIMLEEKKLSGLPDYSKQRRLLITSYRIWIRRYNNAIERSLGTHIEKNDKKCITEILGKAKKSKETLLENLLQLEDEYIRELYRDTEIVNEDDNVIIQNLLMLKGHDHKTPMDVSIYVNRVRAIHTNLGRTLSTKDIIRLIDKTPIAKSG